MPETDKTADETTAASGSTLLNKYALNAGVADVLQLLAYCNRIQTAFPTIPNPNVIRISNSTRTC
jgi:hypothetical protein